MPRPEIGITPQLITDAAKLYNDIGDDSSEIGTEEASYAKWIRERIALRAQRVSELGLFPTIRVMDPYNRENPQEPLLYVSGSSRRMDRPNVAGGYVFSSLREFITPEGEFRTRIAAGRVPQSGLVLDLVRFSTPDRRVIEVAIGAFVSLQKALSPVVGR